MNAENKKTIVIFSGLPYSGKTAIIHKLSEWLPGKAIYVDSVFRDLVSEEDVCLENFLKEGPNLVDGIIKGIAGTEDMRIYIEVGIMQAEYRGQLMQWIRNTHYRLIPILLQCNSREAVRQRQLAREKALALKPEKLKIAIGLDELFGPIFEAFDEIMDWEGYHKIDTSRPIEACVEEICRLILDSVIA